MVKSMPARKVIPMVCIVEEPIGRKFPNGFDLNQVILPDLITLTKNDLTFFQLSKDMVDIFYILFLS